MSKLPTFYKKCGLALSLSAIFVSALCISVATTRPAQAAVADSLSSSPYAAYSLRKVVGSYAGPALVVRRSSDNATTTVGFTANGDLATSTLTTFCGSNTCYVATWYDQSGNGLDQVQATAAKQPVIVNAGTLVTQGGTPSIKFASSTQQYLTYTYATSTFFSSYSTAGNSVAGVFKTGLRSPTSGGVVLAESSTASNNPTVEWLSANNATSTNNGNWFYIRNDAGTAMTANAMTGATAHDGNLNQYLLTTASSTWTDFLNGSLSQNNISFLNTVTGTYTFNRLTIGAFVRATIAQYYEGFISEILAFKNVLTNNDRNSLTVDQTSYYGIALTATPNTPTGLVATPVNKKISLSWSYTTAAQIPTVTDYQIQYKLTSDTTWSVYADGVSATTTATLSGFSTGVSYDLRVAAINTNGMGSYSLATSVTIPSAVPDAPAVAFGSLNGKALLGWSTISDATGYIAEYRRQGDTLWTTVQIIGTTTQGYEVAGLTNGLTYEARAYAYNTLGTSSPSTIATATPSASLNQSFYNQILSTGQSLSVGVNGGNALTISQAYSNKMLLANDPSVFLFYNNISLTPKVTLGYYQGLTPLIEPNTHLGTASLETPSSGMSNMISYLANLSSKAYDTIVVLDGIGSQVYSTIKKGTLPYAEGIVSAQAAMNYAIQAGKPYIVRAVTVIHGETDESNLNTGYEANLVEWQSNYETDLKALTGQSDSIPMFLNQMSSWPKRNSHATPTIAIAQLAATRDYPSKFYMVTPLYMFDSPDGVHLNNWGYRRLGQYFGKAMKKVLVDNTTWKPTLPVSEVISGNVIEARFNVPVAPLVFDTSIVTAKTNYGFEYFDSATSSSITNVEIIGGDTIRVTLNQAPSGSNQRLRYAYTSTPNVGMNAQTSTGVGGNLRDSDVTPDIYQDSNVPSWAGSYLYNWSVTFDDAITQGPSAPQLLIASTTSTTTTNLSWNAPSSNGGAAINAYLVEYKPTSGSGWTLFGTSTVASSTVTSLQSGTSYDFRVRAVNANNVTGLLSTIATATTTDTTAPIVSAVTASSTDATSATVAWTTDEAATSQVVYGLTSSYGSATTSASLITSHSLGVSGLSAATTYHYAVVSADASGNTATSTDNTFVTAAAPSVTVPMLSAITASTPNATSATIVWTTDAAATSRVAYGLTTSYGQLTTLDPTLVTSHSVSFSGLTAATTYHYYVISTDASNNTATSTDAVFTTLATQTTAAAVISGNGPIVGTTVSVGAPDINGFGTVPATTNNTSTASTVGATTFSVDLSLGDKGTAVTKIQKYLISLGYQIASGATGYFGTQTKAAVINYQTAMNITPASGIVGPLTREKLNATTSTSQKSNSALSTGQRESIITLIQAFGADSATLERVRKVLSGE